MTLRDGWTTREQAVTADCLRAALDASRVRIGPNLERRLILELVEQLESAGWTLRPITPAEAAGGERNRRHQERRDRAADALHIPVPSTGGRPPRGQL